MSFRTCFYWDTSNKELLMVYVEDPDHGFKSDNEIAQLLAKEFSSFDNREEYENVGFDDLELVECVEIKGRAITVDEENCTMYDLGSDDFKNFQTWLDDQYPPEEEEDEEEETEENKDEPT